MGQVVNFKLGGFANKHSSLWLRQTQPSKVENLGVVHA